MKVNSDLKTWQFNLQGKYKNFIILGNVLQQLSEGDDVKQNCGS